MSESEAARWAREVGTRIRAKEDVFAPPVAGEEHMLRTHSGKSRYLLFSWHRAFQNFAEDELLRCFNNGGSSVAWCGDRFAVFDD